MTNFNKKQINALLPLWSYKTKKGYYDYIQRKVLFPSFSQACSFMKEMFTENEKMNHHCKYINDYTKVKIKMYTHSKNCVSAKDVAFANIVDRALNNYEHTVIKENNSDGMTDT
ncbi:pterin-4a-carbinolamine dehydratase [Plasmodium gonderi]|uniref:4a-hydroxytetrahydrobiopterin dehydratase n=1 Tax=Plasmodium gonderi TaxID=77519 RepID=A0A1Y1JEA4_PLAGO|nr:pterin-4a-carbinolamine dehydratase [Plasmodium gonderi]GAW80861.1 pterin-4a-carbinolamine dehydratase [Plasmodium gonderi]